MNTITIIHSFRMGAAHNALKQLCCKDISKECFTRAYKINKSVKMVYWQMKLQQNHLQKTNYKKRSNALSYIKNYKHYTCSFIEYILKVHTSRETHKKGETLRIITAVLCKRHSIQFLGHYYTHI